MRAAAALGAGVMMMQPGVQAQQNSAGFGPSNPFYAVSTLPFHAPPFDRIKDADFQPAFEAGMAEQRREIDHIANDPAAPGFENTIVAIERSGRLLNRVQLVFNGISQANTNPALQHVQEVEAAPLAAQSDYLFLNAKLFARVQAVYDKRASLGLDPESMRLLEWDYLQFVKAGAKLNEADKARLRKLNGEESVLEAAFNKKLLAATQAAAFVATDPAQLAGMPQAQVQAAHDAARARNLSGYVLPLQNTTQQPSLAQMSDRAARQALFQDSWTRAERGDANDTRATIARIAQLRAQKAALLGFPNYASWALQDQMAKTPETAIKFMDAVVPSSTAKARGEARDIQAVIDAQHGGFQLQPWDWNFYSEQVRKAKYDLNMEELKPYFELDRVLQDGVFYAANQLYGVTFKERHDLPVYQPDVRTFECDDSDGKPLALLYFDYWKRDNKNGGAWMSNFVDQSSLLGTLPVIYNVANFQKPAPGQPALISFDDVITMFHEFGHGLNGIFADTQYPTLSGANTARDFVEFPSQFNEHWATYPAVFHHYARNYRTGQPMPDELFAKLTKAATFNKGYASVEALAAQELDMQWHLLPADAPLQDVDAFEKAALEKTGLAMPQVPPRYRSSYFLHIWSNGYAAGYYAYLWSEMLDDDAFQWFQDHGGLTRANGDRFRRMVLSRGNTQDLETMYETWRGGKPSVQPLLKQRGLTADSSVSQPAK
jgi:peptidyl-dipeptidase Dcp